LTLLDRIARAGSLPANEKMAGHAFEHYTILYLEGLWTLTKVRLELGINNAPQSQLDDYDKIKTEYDTLNVGDQRDWIHAFIASTIALQDNAITKGKWNTDLGLTLDAT
jgi:hypothetical protein